MKSLTKVTSFSLKNIVSIKINDNESLHEHLVKIKNIREQLNSIVVITLKRLLVAYDHFIETLNITTADKRTKFYELPKEIV